MSVNIAGFVYALVLAAIVVIWIAYCMFIRERHKSESYQYNISDLKHKQYELSRKQVDEIEKKDGKEEGGRITAGIFILPSRHKQKDEDYVKRPDYPESPAHRMETGNDKLIELLDHTDTADVHYRDGIIDTCAPYHSDV